jgi:glutamate racemase
MNRSAPIGIFDSGIGGLTVLRQLLTLLPGEDFVYLGDTARVPYGTKSAATVIRHSLNAVHYLVGQRVKLVVVSCNTASACAIDALADGTPLPVVGAVAPTAREAARRSRARRIGVLGTWGTIKSRAYERALEALSPGTQVMGWPCALLGALAEEGILEGEIAQSVVRHYLVDLARKEPAIDTLLLACTYLPLFAALIERTANAIFASPVTLVDSASAVAHEVQDLLRTRELAADRAEGGEVQYAVTDLGRFEEAGSRILGRSIQGVTTVDLG